MNYLDNLFASLPKTNEAEKAKKDLAANMEEKYRELKSQGKSENESIGIVISEFGNIDELISMLGIKKEDQLPILTKEQSERFIKAHRTNGLFNAIGVLLCILAPALLLSVIQMVIDKVLFPNLNNDSVGIMVGVGSLIFLIAIAVGFFIYGEWDLEKKTYDIKNFSLTDSHRKEIETQQLGFKSVFTFITIISVVLYITSPSVFVLPMISGITYLYSTALLLVIVAFATMLLVSYGVEEEAYEKLLKGKIAHKHTSSNNYHNNKPASKAVQAIISVVWSLTVITYLLLGFLWGLWHPAWLIFPVVGIITGAVNKVIEIYDNE